MIRRLSSKSRALLAGGMTLSALLEQNIDPFDRVIINTVKELGENSELQRKTSDKN